MTGALLLLLIGLADLARAHWASRHPLRLILPAWLAVVTLAATGLGLPFWSVGCAIALAVGWMLATRGARHTAGVWPAVGLGVALAALLAFDPTTASVHGYLVDWHASAPSVALRQLPLATVLLAAALATFLVESGNMIVRAAIRLDDAPTLSVAQATPRRRWRRDLAAPLPIPPALQLRGGRLIGPLERLLLLSLVRSGLYVVAGAVIAAKGIVRFPEISRDDVRGSKAEYFLVGSLVSWTLSLASAGLLLASVSG